MWLESLLCIPMNVRDMNCSFPSDSSSLPFPLALPLTTIYPPLTTTMYLLTTLTYLCLFPSTHFPLVVCYCYFWLLFLNLVINVSDNQMLSSKCKHQKIIVHCAQTHTNGACAITTSAPAHINAQPHTEFRSALNIPTESISWLANCPSMVTVANIWW